MIFKCGGTGSSGNCYALMDSHGQVLLIEAGIPYTRIAKLIDWRIKNVVGCIVTHSHLDHSKSAARLAIAGVPVYKPFELDECRESAKFGNYMVTAFPMVDSAGRFVHTNNDGTECPVYGFLIKHPEMGKMVYFTDCEFCRYTFRKNGIEHFLLGVDYQEEYAPIGEAKQEHVIHGHMSARTAFEFIKTSQTERLQDVIFCHMSESCDGKKLIKDAEEILTAGARAHLAVPEMNIKLYKDCPF